MKRVIFTIALVSILTVTTAYAQEDSTKGEGLHAISFMIGNWKLTEYYADNPNNIVVVDTATLHVKYTTDGRGIVSDGLHPYEGMEEVFAGTIVYRLHPNSGHIVGVSVNSLGNRKFLESTALGDSVTFETRGEMFNGDPGYSVGTYYNIEPNRFEFSSDRCSASGDICKKKTYYYVAERISGHSEN